MTDTSSNDIGQRIPKLALHLLTEDVRREVLEFLEQLHPAQGLEPAAAVYGL